MQHLQWFPGHMTASMRMMEENLKSVDGVLIVLDARAPISSLNEKFDNLFNGKKILYVINKTDLVEISDVKKTISYFESKGKIAVGVCASNKRSVDNLLDSVFDILKEKQERNKRKGCFKPLRVMVSGIPNTGKSTIINALCGGKKTATGNKAGVTRGKQWVKLKDIELLDTPGTMPPAFSNQTYAKRLAYIGSMNDANIDMEDLAYELIADLKIKYPSLLKEKYSIEDLDVETIDIFNAICVKRGFLLRGGDYDYGRCATAIIDDFRKGRIGKICLD
ncbi:MAG: ribosome biogenesis GTPase YlqF [Clostridia bacterium]|nr:ribosome biogenesis GTPase YlqF [Clostridia bacterium]